MDNSLEKGGSSLPERLPILITLRRAFENQDITPLGIIVGNIQRLTEKWGTLHCPPMGDVDLQQLLKTGRGMIEVGSGTSGQRIFFNAEEGEIFMNDSSERDNELGKKYHTGFRDLFGIREGEELRVRF